MFLCLTIASTIRSDMFRGRQTYKSFPVSLGGQIYKVDITCAATKLDAKSASQTVVAAHSIL